MADQSPGTTGPIGTMGAIGAMGKFFSPNRIKFGQGALRIIGDEARALAATRVLLVTDRGVLAAGIVETARQTLLSAGLEVVVFDRVEPETPARVVHEGARAAREAGCDMLVGLGGGTTLDTTKGISLVSTNGGSVLDYVGADKAPARGLPKILVPTTGGSGSEASVGFGVTDEEAQTKNSVLTPFNLADAVVLDPLLTLSLPPVLTAETGIDALSHNVEAYVSHFATPLSDVLALEGIRLAGKSLLAAFAKGENVEARGDMLLAATLGGLAFSGSGLGAVHSFSFALETRMGLTHARAVAIILPHIMEFNAIGAPLKYGALARLLGEATDGMPEVQAARSAASAVRRLAETMGISCRLRDYGVAEEHVDGLVAATMEQARLFAPNPRNLTKEDVKTLYLRAL